MSSQVNNKNILESNIDLNAIFRLNYNFDMLKKIIEALITGQKEIQSQITEIEDNIANMPQASPKTSSGYVHPSEDSDLFESEDYEDITNKLIKRIGKIKKRLSYLEENAQLHDKLFLDVQFELKQRKDEIEKNTLDFENMKRNVEEGNVNKEEKVTYKESNSSSTNNEKVMGLLKDLENTIQQKFMFVDERIKRIEQNCSLSRNEESVSKKEEIQNNNNNTYTPIKSVHNKKEENETQTEHFHDHNNITQFKNNIQTNNTNEQFVSLQKQIMSIANDLQNLKLTHNNKSSIFDKSLKDIQTNIQTSFDKIKPSLDKIPSLLPSNDFLKFQEDLLSKTESDFRDLKLEVVLQKKSIDNFKDQLITLLEDNTIQEEMQVIKRRLEAFMTQLQVIRDSSKKFEDQLNSKPQFDPNKYIDISQFNDFKQTLGKQFNTINAQIESVNSIIDDLMTNILKNKSSFKDLKNLEDALMSKLEELKHASLKQFADKNEITKNIKYLETQIKQLVDSNTSRGNKNESWLIAKKPIGGHLCASCEAYIGDLNNNTSYVPWNKIPNRENGDKLYRIGTGFSKMLQMVNIENNASPKEIADKKINNNIGDVKEMIPMSNREDPQTNELGSKDDGINNQHALQGSHSLPQIKGKRKISHTMEYGKDEVIGMHLEEVRMDEHEEKTKPKIMKIVKKTKGDK